jgi:peptide/nickel transport system substrate-binding protein
MLRKNWFALFSLIIVAAMLLSSCATPTPTQAPVAPATQEPQAPPATQAPQATAPMEQTTEAPAATATAETPTEAPKALADTLVYGVYTTFDKLDPNATTFTAVTRITMHIAETLLWESELGKFEPNLADSWSVNSDATEYTFKLHPGILFSDGTPFNAEAVKFTFDHIVDPETKSQSALSQIGPYKESVVVSEYEVKVVFNSPFAPFLDSVATPTLGIVSPTAFKKVGNADWGITALVGTGPYLLESYVPDSEVVLVRNDNYWGGVRQEYSGPARIKTLDFKIIAEDSSRMASLETNETQFIDTVPELEFLRIKEDPNFNAVELVQPGSGHSLMMNVKNPPMDDLAVRRAIQLASDNKGMVEAVWSGIGSPACGPLTPPVFGYDKSMCDLYAYNPDEAMKVLDEAGWKMGANGVREKDGKPLTLGHYFRADDPVSSKMSEFYKADMAKIGINIELNGLARTGYFDAVRTGKHHTQFWWETGTDPDVLRVLFYSKNAGGGTNRNNYENAEMDKLLDEAAGTTDSAKRAALYSQIQKKVKDEAIMVFYDDPMSLYASSKKLDGVIYYLGGNYPYFYTATLAQ